MRLTPAEQKELVTRGDGLRERRLTAAERKEVVAGEAAIARVAAGQQGMVTTSQLRDAGFGDGAILRRRAGGWLVRLHRGVYQVGVFGGPFGREMAALLACGPGAVLSHLTAVLWALRAGDDGLVHVLGTRARVPGVHTHRGELDRTEVAYRHGLAVTTPTRTLLDLAPSMPAVELTRLIEEAQIRRVMTLPQLRATLDQATGRRGVKLLCESSSRSSATRGPRPSAGVRQRRALRGVGSDLVRTSSVDFVRLRRTNSTLSGSGRTIVST